MIDSVYCDGGLIGINPSRTGGTWAFCHVTADALVHHESGIVEPHDIGLPLVSNNITELIAMIRGLDALPNGWWGTVYTDSFVTLRRASNPKKSKFVGVPDKLRKKLVEVRERLGSLVFQLLGGHPTKDDLLRGFKIKGKLPVSKWNKFCDDACNKERADYEAEVAAYERSKSIALTTPC